MIRERHVAARGEARRESVWTRSARAVLPDESRCLGGICRCLNVIYGKLLVLLLALVAGSEEIGRGRMLLAVMVRRATAGASKGLLVLVLVRLAKVERRVRRHARRVVAGRGLVGARAAVSQLLVLLELAGALRVIRVGGQTRNR